MSILAENLFQRLSFWLALSLFGMQAGCSLIWNAESIDTPPTERMRCDNGIDDDDDGLADCLDEDCAWDASCLTVHRPFEILSCGFVEKQNTEVFDGSSLTNLENQCRNVEATSSFGGNRSVCGPPRINSEEDGFIGASTEYELNNWNVFAKSYCVNPNAKALYAQTCGGRDEVVSRSCDAPVLACITGTCRSFGLFLNGDRTDEQSSGVISRNSDVWFENTDLFEIDTSIRRLYGPDVVNPFNLQQSKFAEDWSMYPCNSDVCSDTCNMEMRFEPKQTDAPGPRLTLSLVVDAEDRLSIRYAVNAGLDDAFFDGDERRLEGDCGALELTGDDSSLGYPVRISGPYYDRNGQGQLLPSLVVSKLSAGGDWHGVCSVPWGDNVGITPETEYQIKFTRQGVFNRGKLLLVGVNLKHRKRVTGTREVCGPSDVAIFQGGRTVCGRATDTVDRVWSVSRYFEDDARRLVIAKVSEPSQYKAYEEIEGVLFEVADDFGALPPIDHLILSLESVSSPPSTSRFRVWSRSPDGDVFSQLLRLDSTGLETANTSALVAEDGELARLNQSNPLLDQLARYPSTIFRTQSVHPGYTWVSLTETEIVIAHSANGVDDWVEQSRSADFFDWLGARTEIAEEAIVDVVAFEVPSMNLNSGTQRILILLTTQNPQTEIRTSHVLTLVRDTTQSRITYLFYHAEVAIEPVTLGGPRVMDEVNCEGESCPSQLDSGFIAMTADDEKRLMIYASTTLDDSFRPQRSLRPESECPYSDSTMEALPQSRVWRRVMYRLK